MAFGSYNSFVGIKKDMSEAVESALETTAQQMLEKLQEFILTDVYSSNHPKWYNRTGDILRAFNIEKAGSMGGLGIKGQLKIKVNENVIDYNSNIENWVHGNPTEKLDPMTFLKIINGDIKQGEAFGFPHIEREPFWTDFLNWANGKDGFSALYKENYAKELRSRKVSYKQGGLNGYIPKYDFYGLNK